MFLERSAFCLDFELVQLSWAAVDLSSSMIILQIWKFHELLPFAFCFSLELCVYFAVYLSIRSNRSSSISLLSAEQSPSQSSSQSPVSVSISVCSGFNALAALSRSQFVVCLIDLIAWVWWPVQDTTRRDATTLAVYVRDVDSSSSSSLDLICFDWLLPPPYPPAPWLLLLPCQMSCFESIFGCMHRPPQLPLVAIMHLKGFRTINLCRCRGSIKVAIAVVVAVAVAVATANGFSLVKALSLP